MSYLDIKIPHSLSRAEALARIRNLFTQLKIQHKDKIKNVAEDWTEDEGSVAFSTNGFSVSGKVNVTPHTVRITGKLPLLFSLYKRKITDIINEKAGALLK